ncbi:pentatricopeptide repeat-containing protein [Cucumis melo var. makuwa]|uniref:Pentatricopeptide repeat-containing protein n=1 Tax=Cucumis melo var. makuwa TaxID=1194695 RepID=A0A5D3DUZ1_CUCMM|nr:pentatricopeptide repeat-containing protein [Cucumis melo var. makuwa]TYK27120.1 pentatricopeptide repeat-containing protein [Cucumis melo var. makuwa]
MFLRDHKLYVFRNVPIQGGRGKGKGKLATDNRFVEALQLFDQLICNSHVRPDFYTYLVVLKACGGLGSSLMNMYAKCDQFVDAIKLFDEFPQRDVGCWNAVISCYFKDGKAETISKTFDKMKKLGFEPNFVTFTVVVSSCTRLLNLKRVDSQSLGPVIPFDAAACLLSSDPEGCTYQSSDPKGYTYQYSDLERCTYQSSDPEGYTYQSCDPEGYTYQSRDPEIYTYQSSDSEGHYACKDDGERFANDRRSSSRSEMDGWPTRLRAEAVDGHPVTRSRDRTLEMEELANGRMTGLENSSAVNYSRAEDDNVWMRLVG